MSPPGASGGSGASSGCGPSERKLLESRADALARWSEEPSASLRCARHDSLLRGVSVGEALDHRLAGHRRLVELEPLYAASVVTVTLDGRELPATEAAARLDQVLALVTAANPLGIELDDAENQRRNDALETLLIEVLATDPLPSRGSSPAGDWAEPGFAVPFDIRALDAAQRFAQLAVFRVGPDAVDVVAVVGRSSGDLAAEFGDSAGPRIAPIL